MPYGLFDVAAGEDVGAEDKRGGWSVPFARAIPVLPKAPRRPSRPGGVHPRVVLGPVLPAISLSSHALPNLSSPYALLRSISLTTIFAFIPVILGSLPRNLFNVPDSVRQRETLH